MYYSKIKGHDPLISRRKKGCVAGVIQLKLVPLVEKLVLNQYPVRILIFGLEQSVPIMKHVHVQQTTATTLLINVPITIGLHVYGNGVII